MRKFAVFILSHGRPDNVKTYKTLRESGYDGDVYIIVDNLDKTKNRYQEIYESKVVVFDKIEAAKITDAGDNFGHLGAVVFARNYSFVIAKDLGLTHFVQLDDDYQEFKFRFNDNLDLAPKESGAKNYAPRKIKSKLGEIFNNVLDYLDSSKAKSIAFAQGGDFIGGVGNSFAQSIKTKRKAMNVFFCRTDRPFNFFGRINEDVNAYVTLGSRGDLFITINQIGVEQLQTQTNPGGLTTIYLDYGTYVKSFYSVMYHPSSVTVKAMGDRGNYRLHHSINWANTVPVILREEIKK